MGNRHVAISEIIRDHLPAVSQCNIVILIFQLLTSMYWSFINDYPCKPGCGFVDCGEKYARMILGNEMSYLTPKFSRLSEICLKVRMHGRPCKRGE